MGEAAFDLHDLAPDAFYARTRSFDFWLGAVSGYLEDTTFGRHGDVPEQVVDPGERDRLTTVLCNYCIGETIALEGASALIRLAPNLPTKIFLATQTVDEARHLEVLVQRLRELGVERPEDEIVRRASPALREFRRRHRELMAKEDWEGALFAQNVILEEMEFAVFHRHAQLADPRTRELLTGIVKDERRHIGFGENELARRLAGERLLRARLERIRGELDPLILRTFEETMAQVGAPESDRRDLARAYLQAVGRLGIA
jgi:1,2-phenylacetyl-CoA epoxidase catalytic subunit